MKAETKVTIRKVATWSSIVCPCGIAAIAFPHVAIPIAVVIAGLKLSSIAWEAASDDEEERKSEKATRQENSQ